MNTNVLIIAIGTVFMLSIAIAHPAVAAPILDVDDEINLGTCLPGNSAQGVMPVKNAGTELLRIYELQMSCGCIAPKVHTPLEIVPGETREIAFEIQTTRDDHLAFSKPIVFVSNDPVRPKRIVQLNVEIQRRFSLNFQPRIVDLGNIVLADPIEVHVELHPGPLFNANVDEVTVAIHGTATPAVDVKSVADSDSPVLMLTFQPQGMPFGRFNGSLTVSGTATDSLRPTAESTAFVEQIRIQGDNHVVTGPVLANTTNLLISPGARARAAYMLQFTPLSDAVRAEIREISDTSGLLVFDIGEDRSSVTCTPVVHAAGLLRTTIRLNLAVNGQGHELDVPYRSYIAHD